MDGMRDCPRRPPERNCRARARAAFLVLVSAGAASAAELILNGSIEQYHGLGRPFAWDFRTNAGCKVNSNPAFARSGTRSLEFDLSIADGPEWDSRRYAVSPGRSYRARFFHRTTEALSIGEVLAFVRWWADDSWSDWKGQALLAGDIGRIQTAGWVEVRADVVAPAGARYGEFHVWGVDTARGPRGRVYLDDFSLKPLAGGAPLGAPAPADGADGAPLYTVLGWDAAPGVEGYELYVGTDFEAVLAAVPGAPEHLLAAPVAGPRVRHVVTLAPYTRYFWRADALEGGAALKGEVLSFATGFDLLEDLVGPTGVRYAAKDNQGRGLDTLQIIENPAAPGYIGVYHSAIDGEFEVRLATSTDLLAWTYRRTLRPNADMPAIAYHPQTGGFFLAHEQWGNPGSRSPSNLRFCFYPSYAALLAGAWTLDFTAPLTLAAQNGSDLEGTPSLFAISADGSRIDVGFHFFDADSGSVDRNGTGVLRGMLAGAASWTTAVWAALNDALVANEASANIGDRDDGALFGRRHMLVEGQYIRGDFGSWRAWFWDHARQDVFPLHLRTRGGSTSFGNMTWQVLRSPRGSRAVCGSCFIFSEGAAAGEAGQAVFYRELVSEAWEPTPPAGAREVGPEPRLHWLAAAGAESHDVYLGTDAARVAAAGRASSEYLGRFETPLVRPGRLRGAATYAWRVDEVFADGSVQAGPVWSFSTAPFFRRGDSNASGAVDIADAVFTLSFLFAEDVAPSCEDAGDANDDGRIDIADAIKILGHLFAQSGPLPPPFGECAIDPTADDLECMAFAPCG